MRNITTTLALVAGVALLAGVAVPFAAAEDAGAITVDLKAAKFKPAEGAGADLFGYNEDEGKLFFYTNGAAELTVKVPTAGTYQVVIRASCDSAMNEKAKFKLSVDGTE